MTKYNDMTNNELWELSNRGSLKDAHNIYLFCAGFTVMLSTLWMFMFIMCYSP